MSSICAVKYGKTLMRKRSHPAYWYIRRRRWRLNDCDENYLLSFTDFHGVSVNCRVSEQRMLYVTASEALWYGSWDLWTHADIRVRGPHSRNFL